MSSTGRGASSFDPLPFVPTPEPFDLRAAKTLRNSAESAPGLTPIRLASQLFDRPMPIGQRPWLDGAPPQRAICSIPRVLQPASVPSDGPRANPVSRVVPAALGVRGAVALLDL